jgi:putative phosphoribosyl transferase
MVAAEIAAALRAPLDVLVVRKLRAPLQPELAIGAVADGEHPHRILNDRLIATLCVEDEYLQYETAMQLDELRRRQVLYRRGRPATPLKGRVIVVADDGIATGATVRAGIEALQTRAPASIVLAVPVGPPESLRTLSQEVDELICLETPTAFTAVGEFYEDFRQTTDGQVIEALEKQGVARPSER